MKFKINHCGRIVKITRQKIVEYPKRELVYVIDCPNVFCRRHCVQVPSSNGPACGNFVRKGLDGIVID